MKDQIKKCHCSGKRIYMMTKETDQVCCLFRSWSPCWVLICWSACPKDCADAAGFRRNQGDRNLLKSSGKVGRRSPLLQKFWLQTWKHCIWKNWEKKLVLWKARYLQNDRTYNESFIQVITDHNLFLTNKPASSRIWLIGIYQGKSKLVLIGMWNGWRSSSR